MPASATSAISSHGAAKFDDNIFFPNLLGFEGKEDLGAGTRRGDLPARQPVFARQRLDHRRRAVRAHRLCRAAERPVRHADARQPVRVHGRRWPRAANEIAQDLVGLPARNGPFDKLALPNNPTGAFDWDRVAAIASRIRSATVVSGLTFGALYGFGNVAGRSARTTRSCRRELRQRHVRARPYEPEVRRDGRAAADQRAQLGRRRALHARHGHRKALFTTVRNAQNGAGAWSAEAGAAWRPSPAWVIGASYTLMKRQRHRRQRASLPRRPVLAVETHDGAWRAQPAREPRQQRADQRRDGCERARRAARCSRSRGSGSVRGSQAAAPADSGDAPVRIARRRRRPALPRSSSHRRPSSDRVGSNRNECTPRLTRRSRTAPSCIAASRHCDGVTPKRRRNRRAKYAGSENPDCSARRVMLAPVGTGLRQHFMALCRRRWIIACGRSPIDSNAW